MNLREEWLADYREELLSGRWGRVVSVWFDEPKAGDIPWEPCAICQMSDAGRLVYAVVVEDFMATPRRLMLKAVYETMEAALARVSRLRPWNLTPTSGYVPSAAEWRSVRERYDDFELRSAEIHPERSPSPPGDQSGLLTDLDLAASREAVPTLEAIRASGSQGMPDHLSDLLNELGYLAGRRTWSRSRQARADRALAELARRSGKGTGGFIEDHEQGMRVLARELPSHAVAIIVQLAVKSRSPVDYDAALKTLSMIGTAEAEAARQFLIQRVADGR